MEANSGKRDQWGSRFGFIMAAAGSAIGLGNIWRFPYITGKYGGGAFVLVYLAFVLVIGASVLLAELAIGRRAKLDAAGAYRKLGGGAWPLVGYLGIFCGSVILSYYAVITGWTLAYMFKSFGGLMEEAAAGRAAESFSTFIANPYLTVICLCAVMAGVVLVVYRGISGGIEKSCKVLMPMLFIILLLLIVRSLTLPGASAGLRFYLMPDLSKLSAEGVLAAFGQGFYSLSLGMGITVTYGSYLSSKEYMPTMTRTIVLLDTMAAFMAGLVIFPAVFAFGIDAGSGPGLTFVTLPAVFAQMPMGAFFSFAFFALLFIAAFTSAIALFEVSVTYAVDELRWTRAKSAIVMGLAITLLGVPSALSGGGHIPEICGKGFLDAVDFITNNAIMPIGGIFTSIFVGWIWTKDALDEVTNRGEFKFKLYRAWLWVCRLVAPVCITAVFITGLKW
ncbi:sodium-dependent transporter [Cloacibacillus sp. An23]|uniref:sodium-dependent transporter n=1 Tax=Cloacibacillus sp. An23 TaxID=1965591 RepID=UPI000B38FEC7|nr:sodium-dependent transporter [Cloacibacillus sp. An23]OUO93776.1 sodium-dependent transporter [Cloacibacillus sp. An23]